MITVIIQSWRIVHVFMYIMILTLLIKVESSSSFVLWSCHVYTSSLMESNSWELEGHIVFISVVSLCILNAFYTEEDIRFFTFYRNKVYINFLYSMCREMIVTFSWPIFYAFFTVLTEICRKSLKLWGVIPYLMNTIYNFVFFLVNCTLRVLKILNSVSVLLAFVLWKIVGTFFSHSFEYIFFYWLKFIKNKIVSFYIIFNDYS